MGRYSTQCRRWWLFQTMPKKYRAGQELAPVRSPLKIVSLSLSTLLVNCRSQLVSGLGKEKLKAMLFYLMWVPSIFNSLMPIHLYAVALEVWCLFTHFMIFFSNHYNIMESLNQYNNVWSPWALENHEPALVRGAPSAPSTRSRIGFGCRPLHLRLWCPSSLPLLAGGFFPCMRAQHREPCNWIWRAQVCPMFHCDIATQCHWIWVLPLPLHGWKGPPLAFSRLQRS